MIEIKLFGIQEIKESFYKEYIQEWIDHNEPIIPASSDPAGKSFAAWKTYNLSLLKEETVPPGMVKAETLFLCQDNGYILGAVNIRYALNDYLLKFGGHIGYGVRPTERNKGYAFIMLKLALDKMASLGYKEALLTCSRSNSESKQTIRKAHGVLENSYELDNDVIERYWIKL
jgi:predicted acetyltransferase